MDKLTLVLGASEKPDRYSNLAIKELRTNQFSVIAIGNKEGWVMDVPILKQKPLIENLDTITIYLNKEHQKSYEDYLLSLKPKRIIFNPGAENLSLAKKAEDAGIEVLEACTLVLLSTGQY